jgi:hypothetical protein
MLQARIDKPEVKSLMRKNHLNNKIKLTSSLYSSPIKVFMTSHYSLSLNGPVTTGLNRYFYFWSANEIEERWRLKIDSLVLNPLFFINQWKVENHDV